MHDKLKKVIGSISGGVAGTSDKIKQSKVKKQIKADDDEIDPEQVAREAKASWLKSANACKADLNKEIDAAKMLESTLSGKSMISANYVKKYAGNINLLERGKERFIENICQIF